MCPLLSVTVTIAPGSPIQAIVGEVSLVESPLVFELITGASGAIESNSNSAILISSVEFPAASVMIASTSYSPSDKVSDVGIVNVHTHHETTRFPSHGV